MKINGPTKEEWSKLYDNCSTNYEWLDPVIKHAKGSILEIGCGSGLLSKRLRELGYESYTNDINGENSDGHFVFDVLREWPDKKFGTIFSCGLLEHFNDEDIEHILTMCKLHSSIVISMVPSGSDGYWGWRNKQEQNNTWPYGNERTFKTLSDIYKKVGFKNITEEFCGNDFNDGKYLLVTIGVN